MCQLSVLNYDIGCFSFSLYIRTFRKKFDFEVDHKIITDIVNHKPGTIEKFLIMLKSRLEQKKDEMTTASVVTDYSQKSSQKGRGRRGFENDMPEVDQNMGLYTVYCLYPFIHPGLRLNLNSTKSSDGLFHYDYSRVRVNYLVSYINS